MTRPIIIAIDGHDASGKTTIAKLLAQEIGGKYIKPYDGNIGDMIVWAYKKKKYSLVDEIALNAIEMNIDKNHNEKYLIFDRHWLSIDTLLHENMTITKIEKPLTILCWADISTTSYRLKKRNDNLENEWENIYYCRLYKQLAEENRLYIIDTSDSPDPEPIVKRLINEFNLR